MSEWIADLAAVNVRVSDLEAQFVQAQARARRLREALERIVASAGDPILIAETALAEPEAG